MRAWAFFVAKNQGVSVSSIAQSVGSWAWAFTSDGGMADNTNRWLMHLSMLDAWHWRLLRVQIDNRDAIEAIRCWDNAEAVFYIDSPYHPDTRVKKVAYASEPDNGHHERLVETLLGVQGAVVLSGYAHPAYWPLEGAG